MSAVEITGFVALGFIAGAYGALLGLGGGVLIVPALLLLHVSPKDAAGTSMAVILANAVSGSVSYLRQRRVDVRAGLIFSLAALPGAFLGAYFDQHVPGRVFVLAFASLLALMGIRILVSGNASMRAGTQEQQPAARRFSVPLAAVIGVPAGILASAFGVGGGIVFVPAMVYVFAFPALGAIATSTFIIALTAVFATASHAYYHDILWPVAGALAAGAIAGAQLGSRIAPTLRQAALLRLFSLALFLTAIWLFVKARV